jgi:hypothetical protein
MPPETTTSFRRAFIAVIAVLAVLVATLAVATFVQGPKLSSVQFDATGLVTKSAQQLRLFTNQNVAAITAKQVAIAPSVPFSVSSTGQVIALQFARPLRYATTYRVSIARVASAADGQSANLHYQLTTASPDLYYLRRSGDSQPDQIVRTGIRSPVLHIAYSAKRITDFAVFTRALAVATLDAQGESSLAIIGSQGLVQSINLPGPGTVDLLHANTDTGILGFTFTSAGATTQRKYTNTLFTVDPNGTALPQPVKDPGGAPLSVLNWAFVPGSSELLAQGINQSLMLIDPAKADGITPLGNYLQVGSIAADGKSVDVSDVDGPLDLSFATVKTRRIVPSKLGDIHPFAGVATKLPGGHIQLDSIYDPKTAGFTNHLVFDNGKEARELFHPPIATGSIEGYSVSPNGQYVAIVSNPDVPTSAADGYPLDGQPTSVTTYFVDITTGALIKSVTGFGTSW